MSSRSGPDTCPACDAPLSSSDRYCQSCGESLAAGNGAPQYEPGPSFVDDEPLRVTPSELPPWLRDLAAAPPPPMNDEPAPVTTEEKLPDWLRAARSHIDELPRAELEPKPAEEARIEPMALGDELSLIGDDDLPEWLRVLGDEESSAAEPTVEVGGARASTVAAVLDVPSISRAWLTQPRAVDPAMVASTRPEFFPSEAEAAAAPAMHGEIPPADIEPEPVEAEAASPVVPERIRKIRILLLVLSILVILLVLYLLGVMPR